MSTTIPPRLVRGDTIGVVAPAGPVKPERLRRGLDRLGDAFHVRVGASLLAPHPADAPSYLAASDDVRVAELEAMLADRDVRAIVLARGGYGVMRILPRLDPELLRRDPKPIVGFSDATALLAWAHAAGVRGIHGPMIAQLGDLGDGDVARLVEILTDTRPPGRRPWPLVAHGRGVHRGPIIAGNLTLMSVLIGTPWELPLANAIAIVEEVKEKPYELDRYLTHLTLAGRLPQLAAAVLGDLIDCADPKPPLGVPDPADAAMRTVVERFAAAGVPLATGAPLGHGVVNEAIPFGAASLLDLDEGSFEILEAAVSGDGFK